MRQLFYRQWMSGFGVVLVFIFASSFTSVPRDVFTMAELESFETRTIKSVYFDRAMDYKDSRLRVVSLSQVVERFHPGTNVDALLLNCFDDYQGIISLDEVRRYDLRLAIAIEVRPEYKRPGWLNPLLTVVPDGVQAPYQERFVTANIRELRFVHLEDYYAPMKEISRTNPEREAGFQAFKNNCVFCHSLKGIGGNKGARLMLVYDFSREPERIRFKEVFAVVHGKEGASQQHIAQFVTDEVLQAIARFLQDPRLVP